MLIAARNINGVRRADLGFYPPSNDVRSDFWDASTDGSRIMANALLYTCPESKPAVAILGSDSTIFTNQEIQDKIKLTGKFSFVDTIGIAFDTPSLNQLLPYSAVLVWSNISPSDPVTLGDNLADYIDSGGGVVLGFASYVPTHMLQGRFNTDNYWVLTPGGITLNTSASIGTVYIPTHPIMSGVTNFNGGPFSARQATQFEALANPVATWSDGQQLITTRLIQNRRRVDLNFFPPSSDSLAALWDRNTDGAKIMANALAFVGVRFQDDFNDLDANDWNASKGTWSATSGALTGTSKGKADNFAPYQCDAPCSIGVDITITTPKARASVIGMYLDKKTFVEIQLMEDKDKIVLTQKSAGVKVAKTKNVFPIDPGVTYKVRLDYDGTYFYVYMDDGLALSIEAGAPASGKVGVRVKSTNNNPARITFDRFIAY